MDGPVSDTATAAAVEAVSDTAAALSGGAVSDTAGWQPGLRESYLFDRNVIAEIHRAAREGIYDIRGFGAKRRVPHFDDLLFLGASVSRYPLEGYRERCATDVVLGTRFARTPLELALILVFVALAGIVGGLLVWRAERFRGPAGA